ncbi:MAG: hypothetical protein KAR47_02475 [Planctomycetes bacterium]|nr:hypothetical protein [Planctomycetota bacterium]
MTRVWCFLISLPLIAIMLAPLFYDAYYHSNVVKQNSSTTIEGGERFEYPKEWGLLTSQGMTVSFGTFLILVVSGWMWSLKDRDFNFKTWLVILITLALLTNGAVVSLRMKHKNDYFSFFEDKIEYKYGKRNVTILMKNIRTIEQQGRAFVLRHNNSDQTRVTHRMISQLNDNEKLRNQLEQITVRYRTNE